MGFHHQESRTTLIQATWGWIMILQLRKLFLPWTEEILHKLINGLSRYDPIIDSVL